MASKNKVFLIDGSSYLYRAFHAMPPLTTSKGLPTGAIKGVVNMLRNLKKEHPKSKIITVFDAKGKISDMRFLILTKQIGRLCQKSLSNNWSH